MNRTKTISLFILLFNLLFHLNGFGNHIHSENKKSPISVIVIDAGHGGKDWGTSVDNLKEKDIVLDIALELGEKIDSAFSDIEIIYTRKKDIFVPLHQRANIANNNNADLFISIHVNMVQQNWIAGTESYVFGHHENEDNLEVAQKENAVIKQERNYISNYKGFDPESPKSYIRYELNKDKFLEKSVMFASYIQKSMKTIANRSDRNVRQAGFLILRQINMPGVLIETGYISNESERNFLESTRGRSALAEAIFDAFCIYENKIWIKENTNINRNETTSVNKEVVDKSKTETAIKSQPVVANEITFSVQIMALKKFLDATPVNFKNEKDIFVIKSYDFNRYFVGRYKTLAEAKHERARIQKKYTNAFIVAFDNNQLISVKKALGKM